MLFLFVIPNDKNTNHEFNPHYVSFAVHRTLIYFRFFNKTLLNWRRYWINFSLILNIERWTLNIQHTIEFQYVFTNWTQHFLCFQSSISATCAHPICCRLSEIRFQQKILVSSSFRILFFFTFIQTEANPRSINVRKAVNNLQINIVDSLLCCCGWTKFCVRSFEPFPSLHL